jgi:hypothetical protein
MASGYQIYIWVAKPALIITVQRDIKTVIIAGHSNRAIIHHNATKGRPC